MEAVGVLYDAFQRDLAAPRSLRSAAEAERKDNYRRMLGNLDLSTPLGALAKKSWAVVAARAYPNQVTSADGNDRATVFVDGGDCFVLAEESLTDADWDNNKKQGSTPILALWGTNTIGNAYKGFTEAYNSMRAGIAQRIDASCKGKRLVLVGFSRGGAIMNLVAYALRRDGRYNTQQMVLITFGCPRTLGDAPSDAAARVEHAYLELAEQQHLILPDQHQHQQLQQSDHLHSQQQLQHAEQLENGNQHEQLAQWLAAAASPGGLPALEKAASALGGTEVVLDEVARAAAGLADASAGWRRATSLTWFWNHSRVPYERTSGAVAAAARRIEVRRALRAARQRLVEHAARGTSGPSLRLKLLIDGACAAEQHSRDLRLPGVPAPLDDKCAPPLSELANATRTLAQATASKAAALAAISRRRRARAARTAAAARLGVRLRAVARAACADDVELWAHVSNVRRSADTDGPFYPLAVQLLEERASLRQQAQDGAAHANPEVLVRTVGKIRRLLSRILNHARAGAGDDGRQADLGERRRRNQKLADEVLRRVHNKLEPTAQDVQQQLEQLVQHATGPDRLAKMYEGWMPFV
jgi:hypothetical protein